MDRRAQGLSREISDIVDHARVARGTFYLYFDSKEQIFLAIVEDFRGRIHAMLGEPEGPVRLAEHHGQAMLRRSFRRWLALTYFAERLTRFQTRGLVNSSVSPHFVAHLQLARVEELATTFVCPTAR